ncbi:hypothetical protein DF186_20300, partial [Enterococcus hirae]
HQHLHNNQKFFNKTQHNKTQTNHHFHTNLKNKIITFKTIQIKTNTHNITQLTLTLPQKHNTLSTQIINKLTKTTKQLSTNHSI